MECFFTEDIRLAYHALIHRGAFKFDSATAEQCYYYDSFVVGKPRLEKHLLICSHIPGVTYKFQNKHLTTFEENFRLMFNLPFVIYFDLETTCGKKQCEDFDASEKTMYKFFIVLLLLFFYLSLYLHKIVILRSFNDTEEQLADASYLSEEMLSYRDLITTQHLLNCVRDVFAKKIIFR